MQTLIVFVCLVRNGSVAINDGLPRRCGQFGPRGHCGQYYCGQSLVPNCQKVINNAWFGSLASNNHNLFNCSGIPFKTKSEACEMSEVSSSSETGLVDLVEPRRAEEEVSASGGNLVINCESGHVSSPLVWDRVPKYIEKFYCQSPFDRALRYPPFRVTNSRSFIHSTPLSKSNPNLRRSYIRIKNWIEIF